MMGHLIAILRTSERQSILRTRVFGHFLQCQSLCCAILSSNKVYITCLSQLTGNRLG